MKIILVGNPNVGKSVIFSRLTGTKVITSNFPGTTVGITRGTFKCHHRQCSCPPFTLIDAPGIYSLDSAEQDAEKVALRLIDEAVVIVNVIDATHLERNLYLTLQLLPKYGNRMIIVLNMWDEAVYHGITINKQELAKCLQAPIVATVGITGTGILELVRTVTHTTEQRLPVFAHNTPTAPHPSWDYIRSIVEQTQTVVPRQKRFNEYLETVTLSPLWGPLIALSVLLSCLFMVGYVGNFIEDAIGKIFTTCLTPLFLHLHNQLSWSSFLQTLLIGTTTGNTINYAEAMGILTSGLYIPLVKVAPVVTIFYALIGTLEDVGYLPRLAILSDTLMHRFALHGFAIIPMVLGAGCNVTGIMATRSLPNRKQRIITSVLLSLTVPCASQTAMIMGLRDKIGYIAVIAVFIILFTVWYAMGRLLGVQERQSYSELMLEVPPYRIPHFGSLMHKLSYRLRNFFTDAIPITIAGIFIILLASYCGLLDRIGQLITPFSDLLWGLPPQTTPALLMGIFRKEIAIGFLDGFSFLTPPQTFVATLILSFYFPCISVYAILYREFGMRTLCMMAAIMVLVASTAGFLAHLTLSAFL